MAELEIHHEEGHEHDPMGQRVGVMAALLAVFLAVVTILSHRTHTEAIIKKTDSNDQWQYYQASRLKYHNLEVGERLIGVHGPAGEGDESEGSIGGRRAARAALRSRRRPAGDRAGAQFALLHRAQDAVSSGRRHRRHRRVDRGHYRAVGLKTKTEPQMDTDARR